MKVRGLVTVVIALAALGVSGVLAAGALARGGEATINIELKNGVPKFQAPDSMTFGESLTIVNHTDPNAVGPHTFSLVKKSAVPKGESERVKCARLKLRVCKTIGKTHDMTRRPPVANITDVEKGDPGWDTPFVKRTTGDSHFFTAEDEEYSRNVTGGPNTLYYICIIHPRMQGKIAIAPAR